MKDSAFLPVADGCRVRVRVTPKAARDELEGVGQDTEGRSHLNARVRAAPDKGAANMAVAKLLAQTFQVSKSAVRLERGTTQRVKIFHIAAGADTIAAMQTLLEESEP